jgi:hypothetical protein
MIRPIPSRRAAVPRSAIDLRPCAAAAAAAADRSSSAIAAACTWQPAAILPYIRTCRQRSSRRPTHDWTTTTGLRLRPVTAAATARCCVGNSKLVGPPQIDLGFCVGGRTPPTIPAHANA